MSARRPIREPPRIEASDGSRGSCEQLWRWERRKERPVVSQQVPALRPRACLGFLLLALALLPASATAAEGRGGSWEITPFAGWLATDSNTAIASSPWLGARLGFAPTQRLALELDMGVGPTSYEGSNEYGVISDYGLLLYTARANLTFDLATGLVGGKLVPFIGATAGLRMALPREKDIGAYLDTDPAFGYGFGLRYQLGVSWGLRLDVHHLMATDAAPYTRPGEQSKDLSVNLFNDFEVALGVFFRLGGTGDQDDDGVPDSADLCPTKPEDRDNFHDADGCPDDDNDEDGVTDREDGCPDQSGPAENAGCPDKDSDGDGVADRLDQCPGEKGIKETWGCKETDWDEDGVPDRLDLCPDEKGTAEYKGCPATDRDSDGVLDPADACPDVPEDRDGFEDIDGCPDPDNDGDGIDDIRDACPNDAEDMNGKQDTDGCPETDPAEVITGGARGKPGPKTGKRKKAPAKK